MTPAKRGVTAHLTAACVVLSFFTSASQAAESAAAPGAAVYSDSGPEPGLAQILSAIARQDLAQALTLTDQLLVRYPTFRLGHLIRGDLLLARGRPITTFGDASAARPGDGSGKPDDKLVEQLADLRAEAIVRLSGHKDRPRADYVPRYLLQMRPDQKHAIVVDSKKSRLYLYENLGDRPRFVADYYFTQGKAGSEKMREGDNRTPVGVYHVTSSLSPKSLPDLYGSGAFPINYPNDWDKRRGRTGSGIWLHGTPSNTFSRPPRASEGCVVLANQDLDALAGSLQIGLTPVIISNDIEWLSLDDWRSERSALLGKIDEWRKDWESRDVERYLRHYSPRFETGRLTRTDFAAQKRLVNSGKTWIALNLDQMSMFRSPGGEEELVVVTFLQDYKSNNLSNQMRKRQYWIREGGDWKIVFEGAA